MVQVQRLIDTGYAKLVQTNVGVYIMLDESSVVKYNVAHPDSGSRLGNIVPLSSFLIESTENNYFYNPSILPENFTPYYAAPSNHSSLALIGESCYSIGSPIPRATSAEYQTFRADLSLLKFRNGVAGPHSYVRVSPTTSAGYIGQVTSIGLSGASDLDHVTGFFPQYCDEDPGVVNTYKPGNVNTLLMSEMPSEPMSISVGRTTASMPAVQFYGLPFNGLTRIGVGNTVLDPDNRVVYGESFALRNMYDQKYDVDVTLSGSTFKLNNARTYTGIGSTGNTNWLSVRYGSNYATSAVPNTEEGSYELSASTPSTNPAFAFEFIERLRGVNTRGTMDSHKSNLYSVRITNSNFNLGITDETLRRKVQSTIELNIKMLLKKIAPADSQLFSIQWRGQ